MLHLSPERLAALADDEPTAAEARHLAGCAFCARERSAYGALLVLARREGGRQSAPVTEWSSLSARLRAERVITTPADGVPATGTSGPPSSEPRSARGPIGGSWWMRAAAAVLIAASGVAYGRYSGGAPGAAGTTQSAELDMPGGVGATLANYRSTADAMDAFLRAQRELQQAAAYLAEREVGAFDARDSETYRTRLAALDGMVGVSRAALYDAPADPLINQLYLTTLGARDATVRQISRALPAGTVLTPY
jgi:hypothetical protein